MEKSMFFNSIIKDGRPDRVYKAEDFALYFGTFIGNGVFPKPSTGLQVLENDNMSVKVSKGYGWINGYMYYNTGNHVVKVEPADGVLNRIDRIVLRLDFSARDIHLDILKGEPATKATAKELTRNEDIYELGLADVAVNKGIIKIMQANITDTRLNKELCGIVHGTIDQVDTTSIFNQFQSWFDTSTEQWRTEFEEWFETVKDILNEDVASKLAKQITVLNESFTILEDRIGENRNLKTNSKDTLVNAINEVFTDVDNGKKGLYGAIVDKGTTPSSQDFKDLESAIRDIKTGGGTAQPSDVLQGKTFTNDSGLETGTMINRGSLTLPPSKVTVSHPSGYYSKINYTGITGKQIETLYSEFKPENIKKGVDIGGTVGSYASNATHVHFKKSLNRGEDFNILLDHSLIDTDNNFSISMIFAIHQRQSAGTYSYYNQLNIIKDESNKDYNTEFLEDQVMLKSSTGQNTSYKLEVMILYNAIILQFHATSGYPAEVDFNVTVSDLNV